MEFILIILLVAAIASMIEASTKKPKTETKGDKLIVQKQQCPPHQWFWQEIVDQDGNKQGERIVCKVCGPLSRLIDGSVE